MKTSLPAASALQNLPNDYLDSYTATLNASDISIEQVGRAFFTASPAWVDRLLVLRNQLVAFVGLKVPGAGTKEEVLQNFKCEIGESVALFKVISKTENEVIFGENDKHLDFSVSLFLDRQSNMLIVSTLVKIHNLLGRLYMAVVKPFHMVIASTITKRIIYEITQDRNQ
ncbi:MAG: DUF2867 domain-containing protein [Anaerolineales bacterium]